MLVGTELRTARAVLDKYRELYALRCASCGLGYKLGSNKCPTCGHRRARVIEASAQVRTSMRLYPGLFKIPNGKTFLSTPVRHFAEVAKNGSEVAVRMAIVNLIESNPNPKVVAKAKKVLGAIRIKKDDR